MGRGLITTHSELMYVRTQAHTNAELLSDSYLVFDVDGPEHLNEVAFGVLQELLDLHVGLQLVELLHLYNNGEAGGNKNMSPSRNFPSQNFNLLERLSQELLNAYFKIAHFQKKTQGYSLWFLSNLMNFEPS